VETDDEERGKARQASSAERTLVEIVGRGRRLVFFDLEDNLVVVIG